MSLAPCCPYHPSGVSCRIGQPASCHAAFASYQGARPPDLYFFSRPPVGLLLLRPGALLTIPKMALSVGFIRFVFSTDTTQAKGLLTFAPVGLTSCWDRTRARQPVGEGLPYLPFRLQGGFTIPPWLRFTRPPYNAGRPSFSGPV